MPKKSKFRTKIPTYRQRKGYTQAIVTLTDSATRRRRDYWLGEHGSWHAPASAYDCAMSASGE